MTQQTFASILDKPANEIERPKPLPVGTYLTVVKGLPRYDKSTKKGTEYIEFDHQVIQPLDDVNEEELTEYLTGSNGEQKSLSDVSFKNTYYLTEKSAFMLTDFLAACGFEEEIASGQYTSRQLVENTANAQVYVSIRHESSQDGKAVFARVAGVAKVE